MPQQDLISLSGLPVLCVLMFPNATPGLTSLFRLRSHSARRIFDGPKICAFRHFVHKEACQTYENLDAQAFKNLNTKIKDEFLAGAVNYLTAVV